MTLDEAIKHCEEKAKEQREKATESVCKRCGRPIMQDSQGNWFSFAEKGGADMRNITETSSSCTTTNPNSVEVYHQSLKGGAE